MASLEDYNIDKAHKQTRVRFIFEYLLTQNICLCTLKTIGSRTCVL